MSPFICFILGVLLLVEGCDSASSQSHLGSLLRIAGAQRVLGSPPQPATGPQVQGVTLLQSQIWPGQQDKPIGGTLSAGSSAVSLFLLGDSAHYILVANAADVTAPDLPTFAALLSFSPLLPYGPNPLHIQAVSVQGEYGPPSVHTLLSIAEPSVDAALVIRLRWQRAADLDLHVEQPNGQHIFSRRKVDRSSVPVSTSGYLDLDSNALCVIDGKQMEQVIYRQTPQSGQYRIRIDTFSLCGQAAAYWLLDVLQDGKLLAQASGQSLPSDTRGEHGAQSGVVALDLVIP
jgi:hypothetical protein